MRKFIPALAACILMPLSAPAFADDAKQAGSQPVAVAAQPVAATANDGEKPICRMMYHDGILIRTQVCHTRKQWDEIRRSQERDVSDFQNRTFTQQPK